MTPTIDPIDCGRVSQWNQIIPESFRYHAKDRLNHFVEHGVIDWSLGRPRTVSVCYTCNIIWEADERER